MPVAWMVPGFAWLPKKEQVDPDCGGLLITTETEVDFDQSAGQAGLAGGSGPNDADAGPVLTAQETAREPITDPRTAGQAVRH